MAQQQTDMRAEIRDRDDIYYSEDECTVSIYHDHSDDDFNVIWEGTGAEYMTLMAED